MVMVLSPVAIAEDKKEERKTGLEKFADLIAPDEFSLQGDFRPTNKGDYDNWHIGELTGGLKWKLQ